MVKSNKTTRRKITRKRQSGFIGFKVFLDTDQDIINWWEDIEPGKGSDLLRQIIREYMNMSPKDSTGIEQLAAQIESLRRELLAKLDTLQVVSRNAPLPTPSNDNIARISKEEADERKQRVLKNKW